jgi:sugar phosphate isomerase/epimerase
MVGDRLLNKMSEAKELLSRVPKLYMTIDVNHSLLQKPEDYIACIGDRVKNLHISDNDGTDERHWLPGEGIINFNAILSNLEKIGYNGTFNYEVNIKADDGVKKVKENFDKLFNDYNNNK